MSFNDTVMKSFERRTPKPYLVPESYFFPDLNSAQMVEIPVGGMRMCVSQKSSRLRWWRLEHISAESARRISEDPDLVH